MKKYLLIALYVFVLFLNIPAIGTISTAHAQNPPAAAVPPAGNAPAAPGTAVPPAGGPATTAVGTAPLTVGTVAPPPDGAWLSDSDVTFAGKNAARSRDLFNWVLQNYKWSTNDNTLISFWAKIRNVVYVFLVLLVMVTAFLMIITGGQSFTAIQFIRKFLLVIILITFSFAIIRILYQIVDIIQLFFIKNPDGKIISSVDLLNISFKYEDFTGYRKYGPSYDESAFMSLLLTKLTAATYFVMSGVLIVRKVILWFFITVSPIYPILLLYFPVRNTAKIWIGEFFRWLLYAPLFAIFLSGLVVLWRQNIDVLPFQFDAPGAQPTITYPTAINILLGGPGQKLGIANSINYQATFAEYIVALIMLWVVIFLPFLLLRIFLDYFSSMAVNNSSAWKYIANNANKILPSNDFFPNKNQPTPPSTPPPPPSFYPTGSARELPMPAGSARNVPVARPIPATTYQSSVRQQSSISQQNVRPVQVSTSNVTATPAYKSQNTSVATSQLVNFSIPTMRDVAKFETSRISSQSSTRQDTTKVNETLQKIANPQSITNPVERRQFSEIKEKLVQAQKQGEPLATSILNAANHVSNTTNVTNKSTSNVSTASKISQATTNLSQVTQQATTQVQQVLQKLSNTQSITNVTEKQQITSLSERLTQESKQGNSYASTILSTVNHMSSQSSQQTSSQVQQIVQKLANPKSIKNTTEREQINKLKEALKQEKEKGNDIAEHILSEADNVQKAEEAQTAILPETNQVQTVNLEDYEEVKKTWTENYQKLDVPKSLDNPDQTREQWIKKDLADTTRTIDLLSSQDVLKIKEGMSEVSSLLPFLLVGGFSQAEIVAYLQAKKHAAEKVLSETQQSKQEEDTLLETTKRHAQASMHMEESLPDNDKTTNGRSLDEEDKTDEKKEMKSENNLVDPIQKEEEEAKKEKMELPVEEKPENK